MANLRVNPQGLRSFAGWCTQEATGLRSALSTGGPGPGFQATSAVVVESDSRVDTACQTLAQRLDDFASKLSSAAGTYLGRDEESAAQLGEILP